MTTHRTGIAVAIAGLALTALQGACASSRPPTFAEVQPPVASVYVLPTGALVSVDGREVGRAPLDFPVPEGKRDYVIRVTSPGFEAFELTLSGERLVGAHVEVVLRPEGFGSRRVLQLGEPTGLLQAAQALLRADRPREAIAFAQASLAAGGDSAAPHRVIGLAARRLGNRDLAVKELSLYVAQAPDSPERREIEQVISGMVGDIEMTPARPARN